MRRAPDFIVRYACLFLVVGEYLEQRGHGALAKVLDGAVQNGDAEDNVF